MDNISCQIPKRQENIEYQNFDLRNYWKIWLGCKYIGRLGNTTYLTQMLYKYMYIE